MAANQAEGQREPLDLQSSIPPKLGLENLAPDTLTELVRRMRDIDDSLHTAAEKMGQLYMFADLSQAEALTRRLDLPMRSASQNERAFAALLDELQMISRHRAAQLKRLLCVGPAAAAQPSTKASTGLRARARQAKGSKT
jgi:hypothetical protein